MAEDTRWRRRARVVATDSGESAVLVDLRFPDRPPVVLGPPAARVWRALDRSRTEDEVVAEVAAASAQPERTVRLRVAVLLDELAAQGFVERLAGR